MRRKERNEKPRQGEELSALFIVLRGEGEKERDSKCLTVEKMAEGEGGSAAMVVLWGEGGQKESETVFYGPRGRTTERERVLHAVDPDGEKGTAARATSMWGGRSSKKKKTNPKFCSFQVRKRRGRSCERPREDRQKKGGCSHGRELGQPPKKKRKVKTAYPC